MKTRFLKLSLLNFILILFGLLNQTFSQTDTLQIIYNQESLDSSDYNYRHKYQFLDINMKHETRMFKISMPTFRAFSSKHDKLYDNFLCISVELKPAYLPIFGDLDYKIPSIGSDFSLYYNFFVSERGVSDSRGIRIYFLKERQMKRINSGNNLNGLYLDFNLTTIDFKGNEKDDDDFYFGFGLQKRINNWSYFDILSYYALNQEIIGVSFRIGFAWGKAGNIGKWDWLY